jgi:hypothetical protein
MGLKIVDHDESTQSLVNETLWPEYQQIAPAIRSYIDQFLLSADVGPAAELVEPPSHDVILS